MATISCELVHAMLHRCELGEHRVFGGKWNAGASKEIVCFGACLQPYTGCWGGKGFSNSKGKCSSETGKWNFLLSINSGKSPLQRLCVESLGVQQGEDTRGETSCPCQVSSLGTPGKPGGLMLAQAQTGTFGGKHYSGQ